MSGRIYKSPQSKKDLTAIFRYYTSEAGLTVARRFIVDANSAFQRLADMPHMAPLYDDAYIRHLEELRVFPISGFEKYLVFYRPVKDGIEIIRVIHSARDLEDVLITS